LCVRPVDNGSQCIYGVVMAEIRFDWDEKKHSVNKRKHRVSFTEAQTAFADENGILIDDPDHSDDEARFILLGLSARLRLLVVAHAYSEAGLTIRIISARKAKSSEMEQYWKRW
jgi:uncharacterized DUF497 family protein